MTRKHLISTAKLEIAEWHTLPPGLVMMILFAFIHRAVEGESIEQTFFKPTTPPVDYQI